MPYPQRLKSISGMKMSNCGDLVIGRNNVPEQGMGSSPARSISDKRLCTVISKSPLEGCVSCGPLVTYYQGLFFTKLVVKQGKENVFSTTLRNS